MKDPPEPERESHNDNTSSPWDLHPSIDQQALERRFEQERMTLHMRRQLLVAASGILPSGYVVWLLWRLVSHTELVVWWVLVLTIDLSTIFHTTRYIKRPTPPTHQVPWFARQMALQMIVGTLWGSTVRWMHASADATLFIVAVLVAIQSVAVIGLMVYRRAVLAFTLGLWWYPLIHFFKSGSPELIKLGVGIFVLGLSIHFYLWEASRQLVSGLEKHLHAEALASALAETARQVRDLATHDDLTGCYNRGHGMRLFAHYAAAEKPAKSRRTGLSLLMLDIDHFKRINDTWGHPAGDHVLKTVASRLQSELRSGDVLARVGGEELMVILPKCTDAAAVAERLRASVAREPVCYEDVHIPVTISIGLTRVVADEPLDVTVARADKALYKAKSNGRNRVESADPTAAVSRPVQREATPLERQSV